MIRNVFISNVTLWIRELNKPEVYLKNQLNQVAGGSKLVKKKNKEPKHRQNKYINKQNLNLYNKGKVGLTFLIVGEGS